MTDAREIKTLFKSVASRNPDLFLRGPFIALKPVGHLYKGIYIDRTLTKDFYSPRLVVFHLFDWWHNIVPKESGRWLARRTGLPGGWFHSDPVAAREFIEVVEADALPFLRGLTSLAEYYELKLSTCCIPPLLASDEFAVVVEVALGDLDRARRTFARIEPHYLDIAGASNTVRRDVAERLTLLGHHLMADDRAALATLLHHWERESARNYKIEDYWQPTPFPLENQPA
ncbi:hypothetical protein G3T14_09810 [Methylobacterium sp. BTF04]|uniref:hypothetical protein n=1 Tax=Methylobacterium sp. BTF04 TaxID=2708300 RepID=UPI0013D73DF8|nr:hypothetical protein [Methylobacterium sp. BTF04]NEU12429.1 hypothetical protein [Methylobacterium sp. BTF04]